MRANVALPDPTSIATRRKPAPNSVPFGDSTISLNARLSTVLTHVLPLSVERTVPASATPVPWFASVLETIDPELVASTLSQGADIVAVFQVLPASSEIASGPSDVAPSKSSTIRDATTIVSLGVHE